ncbi:MAG: trigger factor [Candidatus Margulisiibacteriota bacterium]
MKILSSSRKGDVVSIEIEVSQDHLVPSLEKAYRKLVKQSKIPGFRPGKAPRHIYEQYYGSYGIIEEGVMDAVNDAYVVALKTLDLKVIDFPKNLKIGEYKEAEPVVFSCDIDVLPELTLKKYKGIEVKKPEEAISEEQIQQAIDQHRENYAEYDVAERPIEDGDIIRLSMEATLNGEPYDAWTRKNAGLKVGLGTMSKPFDEALKGLTSGESKSFEINIPADFHIADIANQTLAFKVDIEEVRGKKLPELTDEFAAKISAFKTADEFVADLRKNLETRHKNEQEEAVRNGILDAILTDIDVALPEVLIDREIDASLRDFDGSLRRSNSSLDHYLALVQRPIESLREELKPSAEKKLRTELVIDAVIKAESIDVTDAELEDEIKTWQLPEVQTLEDLKKNMHRIDPENVRSLLKRRKALAVLVEHAKFV